MPLTALLLLCALAVPPPEAVQHAKAGLAAKQDGRPDEAERELRAALALDPTYLDAYWVLAWVLAGRGEPDEAIAAFEAVVALQPDPDRMRQAETALVRLRAVRDAITNPKLDPDGVSQATVVVPLVFPVVGRCSWSDTFLATRGGGSRRHLGQDLMADKLTPLVAAFDGVVWFGDREPGTHPTIHVRSDDGWRAAYIHVNNDNPGTDDGLGGAEYAYAPWLEDGDRVVAGQLIGWVGDSGNAESTAPHLHFELWRQEGGVYNAAPSLQAARRLTAPTPVDPAPGLAAEQGEVRLAGVVQAVDLERGVVVLRLQSRTANGKLPVMAQPQRGWVKWGAAPPLAVVGEPQLTLPIGSLAPGMRVIAIGSEDGQSLAARGGWVLPASERGR